MRLKLIGLMLYCQAQKLNLPDNFYFKFQLSNLIEVCLVVSWLKYAQRQIHSIYYAFVLSTFSTEIINKILRVLTNKTKFCLEHDLPQLDYFHLQ